MTNRIDETADIEEAKEFLSDLPTDPDDLTASHIDVLESLLLAEHPGVGFTTASFLRDIGQDNITPLKPLLPNVVEGLMHIDIWRREPFLELLEAYDYDDVAACDPVASYREQLTDETSDVVKRAKAADALGGFSRIDSTVVRKGIPDLMDQLEPTEESTGTLSRAAARSLGEIAAAVEDEEVQDRIVRRFVQVLRSETEIPNKSAINGLERLASLEPEAVEPAVEALLQIAESPNIESQFISDSSQRWRAVSALGELGKEAPKIVSLEIDRLVELLTAEPRLLRRNAADALGQITAEDPDELGWVADKLVDAASDEDAGVRKAAMEALEPFPDKRDEAALSAIPKFIDDLDQEEITGVDTSGRRYV